MGSNQRLKLNMKCQSSNLIAMLGFSKHYSFDLFYFYFYLFIKKNINKNKFSNF